MRQMDCLICEEVTHVFGLKLGSHSTSTVLPSYRLATYGPMALMVMHEIVLPRVSMEGSSSGERSLERNLITTFIDLTTSVYLSG